jgi:hypothetical protein
MLDRFLTSGDHRRALGSFRKIARQAKLIFGLHLPLLSREFVPGNRARQILLNAVALLVEFRKSGLRAGISTLGGESKPCLRLSVILLDTDSFLPHQPNLILSVRLPLLGSQMEPTKRFFRILCYSEASQVQNSEVVLGFSLARCRRRLPFAIGGRVISIAKCLNASRGIGDERRLSRYQNYPGI